MIDRVDPTVPPSGTGCVECENARGWWFHLRRCATCGHIGCCDTSLGKHATAHALATGHRYIRSFEPGEDWWWDYEEQVDVSGPDLVAPTAHPTSQAVPGPGERVPADWQLLLFQAEGQ